MAASAMLHVRVDEKIKAEAAETLEAMGLSVSDAVRVFLTRVVAEKRIPFDTKVPSAETRAAKDEADAIMAARNARFSAYEELMDDLETPKTKRRK